TIIVLEGLSSVTLLVRDYSTRLPSETMIPNQFPHVVYDPELGWSNLPNADCAETDLFPKSARVTTEAHGFRSKTSYPDAVPPGKFRVLCSGDSFTFGMGVETDATWCAQLEQLAGHGVETVNLGVKGYGLDQEFLRFRRA